MKTEIIKISLEFPESDKLKYCGAVIRYGGLVAFPTETVYGLGGSAYNGKAAAGIFAAKGRPSDNPLIVHVSDYMMAECAGSFSDNAQRELFYRLGNAYWPGPLTMIVNKTFRIPPEVSGGLATVGLRMPSNRIARELIRAAGVPIAAPSANSSGRPSPTRFSHVFEDMNGKVDVIIDGGDCTVGVESTVLDLNSAVPTILRPGAVTRSDIAAIAGDCREFDWRVPGDKVERPKSPGMKYRHYAPKAPILLFSGRPEAVKQEIQARLAAFKEAGKHAAVLATEERLCYYTDAWLALSLGSAADPEAHAARLFECLRRFDEAGAEVILAEALPEEGVDDAVMNRMFRAAGGKIVPVGGEELKGKS